MQSMAQDNMSSAVSSNVVTASTIALIRQSDQKYNG